MTAERLHRMLVDAGLNVRQYTGWEHRGGEWARGKPVGVMQHHTAAPVPYPVARLAGSLIKCNINTKPNGEVWLVAYDACNYSSGTGLSDVLAEVLAGTPPEANARDRGYEPVDDDANGNPYFFNFENDHLGHGEPMPEVQHRAIVVATRVVCDYWGLGAGNVISHAEWSARKTDPYWNGDRRAIETIREQLEEDDMPSPKDWTEEDFAAFGNSPAFRRAIQVGFALTPIGRSGKNAAQHLQDTLTTVQGLDDAGGATAEEIIEALGLELTD